MKKSLMFTAFVLCLFTDVDVDAQSMQFSFGNRRGEYTEGTDGPAHVFGQLLDTENIFNNRGGEAGSTAVIPAPTGPYVDASGNPAAGITLELGTGLEGSDIDFSALPRQTGVGFGDPANGAIDNGLWADYLFSDGRNGGNDHLAAKVGGLQPGLYRVYAIFREAAQPGRTHDVDIGASSEASVTFGAELGPLHVGVAGSGGAEGTVLNDTLELNDEYYTEDVTIAAGDNLFVIIDPTNSDFGGLAGLQLVLDPNLDPPDVLLGDVDLNETVDFLDINPFIQVLATGEFQAEADCDESGFVDFLDIQAFINILSGAGN